MINYFVYIISNSNDSVLYIGITSDLIKRIYEHKNKADSWSSQEGQLN